jgi:hypothetical protein
MFAGLRNSLNKRLWRWRHFFIMIDLEQNLRVC